MFAWERYVDTLFIHSLALLDTYLLGDQIECLHRPSQIQPFNSSSIEIRAEFPRSFLKMPLFPSAGQLTDHIGDLIELMELHRRRNAILEHAITEAF